MADELKSILSGSNLLQQAEELCKRRLKNEPANRAVLRSLAEVYRKLGNRAEAAGIYNRLFQLDHQEQEARCLQIESYMNPGVFRDEKKLRRIGQALVAGRLVVIRNAAQLGFAEKMLQCLDTFSDWHASESYEEHFHFRHHNIRDKSLYPLELAWCESVFSSQATKDLMEQLSGRDCSGETSFSASWYLPGDHSFPHDDAGNSRQVAFVWHLAKNWHPTWGGDFYWCAATRYFTPVFNTLMLFTIGGQSDHFVTLVSPHARSKRLAINGWWTAQAGQSKMTTNRSKSPSEEPVEIINA